MFLKKTLAIILVVVIFTGSTGLIQGASLSSNNKDTITISSSNSTIKSTSKKIVLDRYEITIAPGQTIQIKAQITSETKVPAGNNMLVWKSDKSAAVQVTGQGYIKAIKPNSKAVITVSSSDKKLKASCKVTVMSEQESQGCVAVIENLKVTNQDYILFSKINMNQILVRNSDNTTADKYNWTTKINGETAKDIVKKQTLDNIQEIKIQLIKAKEAGIKLDANDLKSIDDYMNQGITQSGSKVALEKTIKATYGISFSEFRKVYSDSFLSRKYINSEYIKTTVSDSEVKKYYDSHSKDYAKVTVTHILISTTDSNGVTISADKKAEAKKEAEDLLKRVKAGEDTKALAEKNSDDPGVTTNRGEYTFGKGEMVAEFEDWAFSHSVGDTDIVETSYGYHVMKLEKLVDKSYDDVKNSIRSSLAEAKFNENFTKRMDSWKKESQFQILINKKTMEKVDKSLYGV